MRIKEEARGRRQPSNGPERKSTKGNYSTKDRLLTALAVFSVALMIAMIGLNLWKDEMDRRSVWTGSYPMANQHIEWTWAHIVTPEE